MYLVEVRSVMDRIDQRKWERKEQWWGWLEVFNVGQYISLYMWYELEVGGGKMKVAGLSACYMLRAVLRRNFKHKLCQVVFSIPFWEGYHYSNMR